MVNSVRLIILALLTLAFLIRNFMEGSLHVGYYFISLGGSGAKTMEALTHLCIAGFMPERGTLNVLAIDPDIGNGNLERSSSALNNYDIFQKFNVGNDTPLFKTKVSLIKPFPWNPTDHDKTLDDLMGYQNYRGTPIGSLYEVLYTRTERSTGLNEGFRGHPSIGAAVLAKKYSLRNADSQQWTEFIDKVKQDIGGGGDVKIFLAGSVFGGTGAAGIPTIARLLRNSLSDYGNRVSIGGVLILPYFNFTAPDDESKLFAKAENFLTNSKAALKYYSLKDNVFNHMYFTGDSTMTPVKEFSPGASSQKNDAHIVELYAALAATDFFRQPADGTRTFKYICHSQENKIAWNDFPSLWEAENGGREFKFNSRFTQFTRFIFAYIHLIKPVLKDLVAGKRQAYQYPWFVDFLKGTELDQTAIKNFEDYTESFITWLRQIETAQGRDISLIKYSMFEDAPARLTNPDEFQSCDGTNTNLTLHELWYKLTEDVDLDSSVQGFGKFLRRLYEACEVKA